MTRVNVLDEIKLMPPVALKFRDASDLSLITDGLDVTLTPVIVSGGRALRAAPCALKPVASGIWTARHLRGATGGIAGSSHNYLLKVADNQNRFVSLSTKISIIVPAAGHLPKPSEMSPWTGWNGLGARVDAIKPNLPDPPAQPDYIPLFPQVARTPASPRAEVRAHLAFEDADDKLAFARWSVVTITIGGKIHGIGVADERGSVAVGFPYPAPPSMTAEAAAAGRQSTSWPVIVKVYFRNLAQDNAGGFTPDQRDLAAILAQLKSPASIILAQVDQSDPATGHRLTMGQPLILRSRGKDGRPSPYLYLKTP